MVIFLEKHSGSIAVVSTSTAQNKIMYACTQTQVKPGEWRSEPYPWGAFLLVLFLSQGTTTVGCKLSLMMAACESVLTSKQKFK